MDVSRHERGDLVNNNKSPLRVSEVGRLHQHSGLGKFEGVFIRWAAEKNKDRSESPNAQAKRT